MCNSLLIQFLQIYSYYCTTYFHQLIFFFSRAGYSFKLYTYRIKLKKNPENIPDSFVKILARAYLDRKKSC
ncbi:hypothetical protein FBF73_08380 [Streptococcus mitis]|uniref:Uncharacterized protein n=1 Tax=Streptococcus mitis TaxID=28037 RepID=A0A4U1KXB7_STRMT|nr:hypothetical protein FBF73_08380 [Streptococcus mitis]